jgi:hypothetical protein
MIETLLKLRDLVGGYKTYIVMVTGVLTALQVLLFGDATIPTFDSPVVDISQGEAFRLLLDSLGLGTLRAGVSKVIGR